MLPDVGKYTMVCQNVGPAVAGSAGPVPPPLFRLHAMTEIPISSVMINVKSCNKNFLKALERLFHSVYSNLTFDLKFKGM